MKFRSSLLAAALAVPAYHAESATTTIAVPDESIAAQSNADNGIEQATDGTSVVSGPSMVPPSPKCWKSAMHLIEHHDGLGVQLQSVDAKKICQHMSEIHQKYLAIEIARCHMQDLGKPLFVQGQDSDEVNMVCNDAPAATAEDMFFCLRHLSDPGVNAYTMYVSYVQLLCTRLTQELLLAQQHESHEELARRHATLSTHSIEQMGALADQMRKLSDVPNKMREQLSVELPQRIGETVEEHLREHLAALMDQYAKTQKSFLKRWSEQMTSSYDNWKSKQATWWTKTIPKMKVDFSSVVTNQRERVASMSQSFVQATNDFRDSLPSVDSILVRVQRGLEWVSIILVYPGALGTVWVLTMPTRCHSFRPYLFSMVLFEFATELATKWLVKREWISMSDQVWFLQDIRVCTVFALCMAYVSLVIGSIIRSRMEPADDAINPPGEEAALVAPDPPTAPADNSRAESSNPSSSQSRMAPIVSPLARVSLEPNSPQILPTPRGQVSARSSWIHLRTSTQEPTRSTHPTSVQPAASVPNHGSMSVRAAEPQGFEGRHALNLPRASTGLEPAAGTTSFIPLATSIPAGSTLDTNVSEGQIEGLQTDSMDGVSRALGPEAEPSSEPVDVTTADEEKKRPAQDGPQASTNSKRFKVQTQNEDLEEEDNFQDAASSTSMMADEDKDDLSSSVQEEDEGEGEDDSLVDGEEKAGADDLEETVEFH